MNTRCRTPAPLLALIALTSGCSSGPSAAAPVSNRTERVVGFRSSWALDYGRTYRRNTDSAPLYGARKSPRPVLVNVWYPASSGGPEMPHSGYLQIVPNDPAIAPLAADLVEYERSVIAREWLGVDLKELTPQQRGVFERELGAASGCVRNATPVGAKYPLILYHAGAGSSFEDNAGMCRDLAGAGYVVIGSAFLDADGTSYNVDSDNAGRDFEFLIRTAHDMPNVDWTRIGVVGHSAGAHGSLMYGASAGIAADAIVSLDTTQDYYTLADPRWGNLVTRVSSNTETYTTPTMFVAGPNALFDLADSMGKCERVYLCVAGLGHNDYITQGRTAARLRSELAPSDAKVAEEAGTIARNSASMDAIVRAYFDSKLKDDSAAWSRITELRTSGPAEALHVEIMPVGATKHDPGDGPATARSIHRALKDRGIDAAVAEVGRATEGSPALEWSVGFALMYELVKAGRESDAATLFSAFQAKGLDIRSGLAAQIEFFGKLGRYGEYVGVCVKIARAIGGDDPAIAKALANYGTPGR